MPIKGRTFSNISHSHFDGHTTLRSVFLSIRIGRSPWPREHNLCNSDVYKLEFLGIGSECKDINAYGFSVRLSQIPQANSHTSGILNPSRANMYALTQMPSRAPRIPHLLALLVRDRSWKTSVTCVFRVKTIPFWLNINFAWICRLPSYYSLGRISHDHRCSARVAVTNTSILDDV